MPYTASSGTAAVTAAGAAAADHYSALPAAAVADAYQAAGAVSSSNVLQCDLEQVAYTPTIEALHTIFATYGYVQKITITEKNHHWQVTALIPITPIAAVNSNHSIWLVIMAGHNVPTCMASIKQTFLVAQLTCGSVVNDKCVPCAGNGAVL